MAEITDNDVHELVVQIFVAWNTVTRAVIEACKLVSSAMGELAALEFERQRKAKRKELYLRRYERRRPNRK